MGRHHELDKNVGLCYPIQLSLLPKKEQILAILCKHIPPQDALEFFS